MPASPNSDAMSDAVNPAMNPDNPLPQDTRDPDRPVTSESSGAATQESDQWQTVDFPGAISIETIPSSPIAIASSSQADPRSEVTASSPNHLQRENAALRHQVAQLEAGLAQMQIELQLEVARFYCKETDEESATATDSATATGSQSSIPPQSPTPLALAEQTIQQKQAIVDRLTQQLETSQQRIAQLERDCALTQQRYNEQVQLVSQAENTCCDLRMRLHRQQQQTLQFKAALEKSIEMNAALEMAAPEPAAIVPHDSPPDAAQAFIPKAQPVQPWSIAPTNSANRLFSVSRSHSVGLPDLLAKLVGREPANPDQPESIEPEIEPEIEPGVHIENVVEAAPPVPAVTNTPNRSPADALDSLFPSYVVTRTPVAAPPVSEPIFDLSPFIEAGEVDADSIPAHQPELNQTVQHPTPPSTPPAPPAIAPFQTGDTLWADLARLIEPDLASPDLASSEDIPAQAEPIVSAQRVSQNRVEPLRSAIAPKPISLVSLQSPSPPPPRPDLADDGASTPRNPFASFTLYADELGGFDSSATPPAAAESPVPANWPAPVLYPFRQPRKLESMAAVDLPSFPRG